MAETLILPQTQDRRVIYDGLVPQIASLVNGEPDLIANLANSVAALKEAFGFFWIGFYLVKDNQLVLGPFQGPIACTRINYGRGVCGTAWAKGETIIVPDVDAFPGHIVCSSASKSEIVVPVFNQAGDVTMVLDIDSNQLNDFSDVDAEGLARIVALLR
ncbi:MAG: GAF domain-containing protein [Spirosoma sp.]|nr:GAF domain-containing protein [Spirosoma sp.]